MKSEERHELKANQLADWIANFPEWAKENTGNIAYAAVVIIIVGVVIYLKWYRPAHTISREQIEMSQYVRQLESDKLRMVMSKEETSLNPEALRNIADSLDAVAGQLDKPQQAAFALIKRGEAIRAELHYAPADFAKDPNALEFQINKAKVCYQEALEKAGDNNQLAAAAQFGLGLCQEEFSNFEEAKKIYGEIVKNEKYAKTVSLSMARERLTAMDDYKGRFVFVESPKASSPPQTPSMPEGPRIQAVPQAPAPAQTNAPASK
jgi:hypothetical protein